MSSLAAARADNFYFPPEWRPEMGGISKFQGSKGANQYQQYGIIRFELPFDAWCLGCNRHMCKGLRFNAKKEKDGKYFSTTVWAFKTKCPSCDQEFVIKTDPKNSTYDFAEGIRKMEQDFVPDKDDSIITATSEEVSQLLRNDPIYRLQHDKQDKANARERSSQLATLLDHKEAISRNDFEQNQALRHAHRKRKRRDNELLVEGNKLGLSIPLVEPDESDLQLAKSVNFHHNEIDVRKVKEKKKISELITQSIFSTGPSVKSKSKSMTSVALTIVNSTSNDVSGRFSNSSTTGPSSNKQQSYRSSAIAKQISRRIDTSRLKTQALIGQEKKQSHSTEIRVATLRRPSSAVESAEMREVGVEKLAGDKLDLSSYSKLPSGGGSCEGVGGGLVGRAGGLERQVVATSREAVLSLLSSAYNSESEADE